MVPRRTLREQHNALLRALEEACTEFRKDTRFKGRAGVMMALHALIKYLVATTDGVPPEGSLKGMRLAAPIIALAGALADLDAGKTGPLLERATAGNAPPLGLMDRIGRAQAAAAMECLMMAGWSRQKAAQEVAKAVAQRPYAAGIKKRPLWQAVARWRDDLRKPDADPAAVDVTKFRGFVAEAGLMKAAGGPETLIAYARAILDDTVFGAAPVPEKAGA